MKIIEKRLDLIEKMRKKLNTDIESCKKLAPHNIKSDILDFVENDIDNLLSHQSFNELIYTKKAIWNEYFQFGNNTRNVLAAELYYKITSIIDKDLEVDWVKRIKVLESIKFKFEKNGQNEKRAFVFEISRRVTFELTKAQEIKKMIELDRACTDVGLTRINTPGNYNNCVLESITKTINRTNNIDKENPRKAYREAAFWQSILRAAAVELGYRHTETFDLLDNDPLNPLDKGQINLLTYLNGRNLENIKSTKFLQLLKSYLDNYVAIFWSYNSDAGKLEIINRIKGVNSDKKGVSPVNINILLNPGHAEPMFPNEDKLPSITQGNSSGDNVISKLNNLEKLLSDALLKKGNFDKNIMLALKIYVEDGILAENIDKRDQNEIKVALDLYNDIDVDIYLAKLTCEEKMEKYSKLTNENMDEMVMEFADKLSNLPDNTEDLKRFVEWHYNLEKAKIALFEKANERLKREMAKCNNALSVSSKDNEDKIKGGDIVFKFSNPARAAKINKASDQAGFTRGYASGEGNNCFIQSLLQGIHHVNGTKIDSKEISSWENILRDEAVINGFERNGHLGVTYGKEDQIQENSIYNLQKTDGTADNNFRQQMRLNLDNHVLTIFKYNEATGKLEAADIVKGVNAGKNGKSEKIDMLYDRNHFDPLFAKESNSYLKSAENMKAILISTLKNFVRALDGWRISKTVKDDEKYRGGAPDQILYAKMDRAVMNSGFERHEASKDGNNCLLYSVKIAIDNSDGITHTEQEVKKWVDDFRKILVDEYNWHYGEMLDVGNPFDPKQAALIELLKNTLAEKKLAIWSYDSKQDRLIHMITLIKNNNAMNGANEINVHHDKYASHFEPLFRISSQQNRKGSTSGLDNKLTEVNRHASGLNKEVNDLNKLIEMSKELLQLGTETDVSPEIKQKVDNYFKNGSLSKINRENLEWMIEEYTKVNKEIHKVNKKLRDQIIELSYNENKDKLIEEYLRYYPGERTRIESMPKEEVNFEFILKTLANTIEEKQVLLDKVNRRVNYEVSISLNTQMSHSIANEIKRIPMDKITNHDRLLSTIERMASEEIGKKLSPEIVNNLTSYIQMETAGEDIRDLNTAVKKYKRINFYLMSLANNLQKQFLYYDFKDERKGLPESIDIYDAYRKKIESIEKVMEKINSKIEICQIRMSKKKDSEFFKGLRKVINIFRSINPLGELSPKEKENLDNFMVECDLNIEYVTAAKQYYQIFGSIDRNIKGDLVNRIATLENVKSKLKKTTGRKRIKTEKNEYCNKIIDKVRRHLKISRKYLNEIELEQACANQGFKRAFTPGNNNNCVLESITKTINRANGIDKENPRRAYEEAAIWQSILRAEAVELGIRRQQGFYMISDPRMLMYLTLNLIEFKDLNNNKYAKFLELLRLNLNNHILTIWIYDSETKKLYVSNEIKGINAEKEGVVLVRLNILLDPGHADPMYPIESDEFSRGNEFDESMDFGNVNVNNPGIGGDPFSAYSDPARVKAITQASEQAGFTRGYAPGEGNNCFIQSLLQGIHYANGTKADDPQKAQEEAAAWETILRDEAVVNGFERNGHLGVTYGKEDQIQKNSPYDLHKTVGTADNNFRQQLRLNLDKHILTIYKYNEATGRLEAADIVKGVNAGKNGKTAAIDMFYDRNHFDPLFAKNNKSDPIYAENIKKILNSTIKKFLMALDGWINSKAVKDDEKYRGGTPDQILYAKMDRALGNSGFERHEASKDGNNCLLYSVKIAIDNADGITHTEQEVKKWVDDFRKILVEEHNWHYGEMLDVGNPFDPKQAALIKLLKNTLAEKKLQIWSYDSKQDRLIHMIALTSNNGMSGTKEIHVHLDKYASHYEPLFQITSRQNTKGSTSGLDKNAENKPAEVNRNDPGINTDGLYLNDLTDLSKELLQLVTQTDVSLEIQQKVDNYFKNGCLSKTTGESLERMINEFSKVQSYLVKAKNELKNQLRELSINKNKKKIIDEYLRYYPGERIRIGSLPKKEVNYEFIFNALANKIDEKQSLLDKVIKRENYELSICLNTQLSHNIAYEMESIPKDKITHLDILLSTIEHMAYEEVGKKFSQEIMNHLTSYIQIGSTVEDREDLNEALEKLKRINFYLMSLANNIQRQFVYYDFKDERKGLRETIDIYDRYRKKIEIIEKTREKIINEIEMYQVKMGQKNDARILKRLENVIKNLRSINSLDELPTKDKKILDNIIVECDLSIKHVKVEKQYYHYFGIGDDDPKEDLVNRIMILENIHSKLEKATGRKRIKTEKIEYCKRILDKVNNDLDQLEKYLNDIELEQACANQGLKRAFTPGNNNNCILESITKTINRANGRDKENPRRAYEEAAFWQSILRAEAVELGFRDKQGFYLISDPDLLIDLAFYLIEFKDLTNNKHAKFIEFLRLNLDNYVLTIWKYDPEVEKLYVFNEIKGINAGKEGIMPISINILANPNHAEPMYPIESDEFSSDNEIDESMDFGNVNNRVIGGDPFSAYSDPARVKAITQASEQAGFTRGYASGEGNNCFIQSLLQGIHYANGTKANDPQKAQEEAAAWETILRDEAIVNGFERNGHLGITYGKEDQIQVNTPYDLHKTDGTADNNFRQQLRLNLDNHILTIYKYNQATGKLEAADIVKGVNAGKDGKSVEIDMLYDRNHFDPLFAKNNKSDPKYAEKIKEILHSTLKNFVRALDDWRINKAVKDNEKYRGGTQDQILYAKMDRALRNSGSGEKGISLDDLQQLINALDKIAQSEEDFSGADITKIEEIVNRFYKYGCFDGGKSTSLDVMSYYNMYNQLTNTNRITDKIVVLDHDANDDEIIQEYKIQNPGMDESKLDNIDINMIKNKVIEKLEEIAKNDR